MVTEKTKGICYGLLDSMLGEFCGLVRRDRPEFNIYAL